MTTESMIYMGAGIGVLLLGAFFIWLRAASRRDREVLRQMAPLMEDLWNPLRFLADLRSVWPDLTETQRQEIETSSVYKDEFHKTRARDLVTQLGAMARRVRSARHWRLRGTILKFLREWESQEPDALKVLVAMVRRQAEA